MFMGCTLSHMAACRMTYFPNVSSREAVKNWTSPNDTIKITPPVKCLKQLAVGVEVTAGWWGIGRGGRHIRAPCYS